MNGSSICEKSNVLLAFIGKTLILGFIFVALPVTAKNSHRADLLAQAGQFFQAVDSSSLDLASNITLEAWVKPTSLGVDRILLAKSNFAGGHSYALSIYADGRLRLDVFQNDTTFRYAMTNPGTLQVGVWQHIAATYDHTANTVHIFVNGVDLPFMNGGGVITGIQNTSTPFTIGARLNGSAGTEFFDGSIDEVRVWSTARTQQECRASMLRELTGSEAGLSACWKLNDSLADSTPNANSLTFRDGSLKGHYRLEDTTDSSMNGNNLTNNGAVAFNTGKFGKGADLGASNTGKRLYLPDDFSGSLFNGSSSWSLWFNPSSQPVSNSVFELIGIASYSGSLERGYRIQYVDEGGVKKLKWSRYNYGGTGTDLDKVIALDVGTWHHLALVYEASSNTLKGFLDGVEVASKLCSNDPSGGGSAKQLSIGSWVTPLFFTSGMIDDVVVLGRALSQGEIGQLQANEFAAEDFVFKPNDLPFSEASLPVARCADNDTNALYHLENTDDDSGHAISLINNNFVTFSPAILGTGAGFGTNNTSKTLSSQSDGGIQGGKVTLSAWIKPDSLPAENSDPFATTTSSIVWVEDAGTAVAYNLHLSNVNGTQRIYFSRWRQGIGTVGASLDFSTPTTVWTHVLGTYDPVTGVLKVYVNGIEGVSSTQTGNGAAAVDAITIGGRRGGVAFYSGAVDEVLVSSRVFSSEEVMKSYGGIVTAKFSPVLDGALRSDRSSLATWSELRQGATGASTTDPLAYLCRLLRQSSSVPGWRDLHRGVMHFDSSPLPDGGISINHTTIDIRIPNKGASAASSLVVVRSEVVSDTSLANTDFNLYGTTELAPRTSFASIATGAINRIPLNDSGLGNLRSSGVSKFFFLVDRDFDNSEPSEVADRYLDFDTAESTNEKPKLVVEYHALSAASISGAVVGTNLPEGVIRVVATSTTTSTNGTVTISTPGPYSFAGLSPGQSYNVIAFVDANANGSHDPLEWYGNYAGSPLLLDGPKSGIDILVSVPADSDNDGLPDRWETANGLVVGIDDAGLDKDGDGLTNLQELWLGLGANDSDSDNDGLLDGAEVDQYGSNPLQTDSDGDGFPDKWEADHGLDLNRDDRKEDRDFDFLTNAEEFLAGLNPASADSDSNGTPDYRQFKGKTDWDALYDRNDRILGVRHERGASFGYQYDGNSNLVRQVKLGRDSDNDGLSDLWEFSNGLDPKSPLGTNGLTGDSDGDGWTNYQEQLANSNPINASSKPGVNGAVVGSLVVPFSPTHFVSSAGQLDNTGSHEFVVAADGDPGTNINFVRVYTEGEQGWRFEDVNVGSFGVTSSAIGQFPGKRTAIYLGLRKPGGTGKVTELVKDDAGIWQMRTVTEAIGEATFVTGFRNNSPGTDLIFSGATRLGPDGALYRVTPNGSNWDVSLLDGAVSHRDRGVISSSLSSDRIIRLLDQGGIQISDPKTGMQSLEEFDDGTITGVWTTGGHNDSGGSWSVQETGGNFQFNITWTTSGTNNDSDAWAESNLLWQGNWQALQISIPSAGHSNSLSGGDSYIQIGDVTVFSNGTNATRPNVLVQVIRNEQSVYFRRRVNGGAWEPWGSGTLSAANPGKLRLGVWGGEPSSGSAHLNVDYVRYLSPADMLASGASTDFSSATAAYSGTANSWYFKTPAAVSWRDAQLLAHSLGGSLTTLDSSETNTWLQGKFSGEFWIGYYRNFSSSPWQWVNNSRPSLATTQWASGQPLSATDQVYAFSNAGLWSSASGTELKYGIIEFRSQVAQVKSSTESEPVATNRLQIPKRNLTVGRFNSASSTEQSFVSAFIEDKAPTGIVNEGDEFVVSEMVQGTSPWIQRTLSRRVLAGNSLTGHYGLAAIRTRTGSSDFLVTAECDGRVHAWLPGAPGSALERKTLSVDHIGKSWHGLERIPLAGGVDGLVGLRVTGASAQSVDVIYWSPYDLGFSTPPVIQQSPPTARLLASSSEGGITASLAARLWDSEGNLARLGIQFKNPTTGLWQDAGITLINGLPPLSAFNLSTGPAGVTHAVVWNAGQDLGTSFRGSVLLRSQATDNSGSGEWSGPLAYTIGGTTDTDGDGMPDAWETSHGLNPSVADASLDKDSDGVKNLMEFALGMNPQISDLHLLPKLTIEGGYAVLTVDRNPDASGLVFAAEKSIGMSTWDSGTTVSTMLEDTPSRLKVRLNQPVSNEPVGFVRLRVSKP